VKRTSRNAGIIASIFAVPWLAAGVLALVNGTANPGSPLNILGWMMVGLAFLLEMGLASLVPLSWKWMWLTALGATFFYVWGLLVAVLALRDKLRRRHRLATQASRQTLGAPKL
jgi:hypothetical protein